MNPSLTGIRKNKALNKLKKKQLGINDPMSALKYRQISI